MRLSREMCQLDNRSVRVLVVAGAWNPEQLRKVPPQEVPGHRVGEPPVEVLALLRLHRPRKAPPVLLPAWGRGDDSRRTRHVDSRLCPVTVHVACGKRCRVALNPALGRQEVCALVDLSALMGKAPAECFGPTRLPRVVEIVGARVVQLLAPWLRSLAREDGQDA